MQGFTLPSAVYCGEGALNHLSELDCKSVFIIADPYTVQSGLILRITDPLDSAHIKHSIYSDVHPDPSVEDVVAGVSALLADRSPCIVAVGGGSSMDLSKCVRQIARQSAEGYSPKLIAIPTTSGTGSEVTSYAVITDREKGTKHALTDNAMLPEEVILDVEMVKTVPAKIAADTGMDVIAHAFEAYVSTAATPMSDMYCEKSANICFKYLEKSYKYEQTGDLKAREKMHLASNIAGAAFNAVSLGLNHGMAHQLGARFHIPHGRANAILLPNIIAYNSGLTFQPLVKSAPFPALAKYAEMSKHLKRNRDIMPYEAKAEVKDLITQVEGLRARMKMPARVSEAVPNLKKDEYLAQIPDMTRAAISDKCTVTNPRIPTPDEVAEIFKSIW